MARSVPDLEEQRNAPEAFAEGLAKLDALPEEHLIAMVDEFKRESEDTLSEERIHWQDYWDLWEGYRDYSEKEEWQSKMVIEKPFGAVEQATAQIQRALLDSPEFLKAEGSPSMLGFPVGFWESYIRAALEKAMFIPKYTDCVQVAFITGIGSYLKPRWRRFEIDTPGGRTMPMSFLSITNVLPWKIYRDPDSKPREQWSGTYIIHADMVDLSVLERSPVYVNLEKLTPEGNDEDFKREGSDRLRQKSSNRSKFRKQHLVDEYWGDVIDENGHFVAPDILLAKSRKTVIRTPAPMPINSWDTNTGRKRWPFISCTPFTHPHRFEGRGIIQQIIDIVLSYENGVNLTSDAMNWKINNPTEFDTNLMTNPTDTKVVPGKGFTRKATTTGSAVQPLRFAQDINIQEILAFLEYLDKNYQNSSFINEFVVGLPGYRSDITKGEVQIKTAQSLAIFDRMGRSIELAGKDFADLTYDMLVQFTDASTLPVIRGLLPELPLRALVQATPEMRYTLMRADLQLKFLGVSQALQRADQLRRLMQISVIAGNPQYLGRLENPSDLLRAMVDLLGYSDKIKVRDLPEAPMEVPGAMPGGPPPFPGANPPPGANGATAPPRGVGEPPRLEKDLAEDAMPEEQGLFAGSEG